MPPIAERRAFQMVWHPAAAFATDIAAHVTAIAVHNERAELYNQACHQRDGGHLGAMFPVGQDRGSLSRPATGGSTAAADIRRDEMKVLVITLAALICTVDGDGHRRLRRSLPGRYDFGINRLGGPE